MERMDNVREHIEALEQQMNVMGAYPRTGERRRRWWSLAWPVAVGAALGLALALPLSVQAKVFRCGGGDVPCLIAAINEANANGQTNTIRLEAGTYTLTTPDNPGNGLPVITSPLTITGRGADTTSIARPFSAPAFRILTVAAAGTLTLKRLTLRGGDAGSVGGGGILNFGTLTLLRTTVTGNRAEVGAGISTSGTATILHSTIASNAGFIIGGILNFGTLTLHATTITGHLSEAVGGISNGFLNTAGGTVIITESAITGNAALNPADTGRAGIFNNGTMVITNTTIARNTTPRGFFGGAEGIPLGGGGIVNKDGSLLLMNSTVAENEARGGAGIAQESGTVLLLNTLLAQNRFSDPFFGFFPPPIGIPTVLGPLPRSATT